MNQNAAPSPSEAPGKRWAEVVRAQGLRATRDVLRVLSVLESAPAPLSHEGLMRGESAGRVLQTRVDVPAAPT